VESLQLFFFFPRMSAALLLVALAPALTSLTPSRLSVAAGSRLRAPPPSLVFGTTQRKIFFTQLDERKAVQALKAFPRRFSRWGVDEWECFGASALVFSERSLPNGVSLQYYQRGAGLREDGALELTVERAQTLFNGATHAIVVRSRSKGGREKQEEVIFKLLLAECQKGSFGGKIAPGIYPPTGIRFFAVLALSLVCTHQQVLCMLALCVCLCRLLPGLTPLLS
jgi:hypothetical protein